MLCFLRKLFFMISGFHDFCWFWGTKPPHFEIKCHTFGANCMGSWAQAIFLYCNVFMISGFHDFCWFWEQNRHVSQIMCHTFGTNCMGPWAQAIFLSCILCAASFRTAQPWYSKKICTFQQSFANARAFQIFLWWRAMLFSAVSTLNIFLLSCTSFACSCCSSDTTPTRLQNCARLRWRGDRRRRRRRWRWRWFDDGAHLNWWLFVWNFVAGERQWTCYFF